MNTLRVTTTPNSAVVREPRYCAPHGLLVNGIRSLPFPMDAPTASLTPVSPPALSGSRPHSSAQHLGGLFLQDDIGITISAEIRRDRPGAATARVEIQSCGAMIE